MQNERLIDKIRDVVSNIFGDNKIELVDITYGRKGGVNVLRILADTETGITVDECARMNEIIGETLDRKDLLNENYTLEVSSPGLDRPLKKKADFSIVKGERICVYTYAPVNGKKEFIGVLETVDDAGITVFDDRVKLAVIPFDKISKATLDYRRLL